MRTFDGFWPALLTPYTADDRVNLAVLRDLVDHHLARGVTGFYLCGSTGEGAFLSVAERQEIAAVVTDRVAGRAPVIVHVGAAAINEAVALAEHAAAVGAAGISSILPPVVYDQRGVVPFFTRIAAAAPELPFLPYLLGLTRDAVGLMRDLSHIPNLAGSKYTGSNMYELSQLVDFRSEGWTIFSGMDEQALLGLMYGAHGVIGSTLNFMPGVYRKIGEHLRQGEAGQALDYQQRGNRVTQVMLSLGFAGCMRAAMSKLGFEVGAPRLPNLPLPAERRATLFAQLAEAGFDELAAL